MGPDQLRQRATALGVETRYQDVEGRVHDTPEPTLRAVIEVLEADSCGDAPIHEPVVVVGGPDGSWHDVDVGAARAAELVLVDGTTMALPVEHRRVTLPVDVPFGCHLLHLGGPDGDAESTVVVAPPAMPRHAHLAGRAGLFVPAYALWDRPAPLPSFGHLAALAERLPALGLDVLFTLPLYAAFLLDVPFDPSPYAPMSRLHWNEVYLDEAGLPAAEVPAIGDAIDWRTLARRRRQQLLSAARDLDAPMQAALDDHVRTHPDVAEYARFRVERPDPIDAEHPAELVRRSHLLAQLLAADQLGRIEGPGRAALALDLPIGSHPAGFEMWAHGELFAAGMTVGAPPDALFAGGQNWGFPPSLPGIGRRRGHLLWRQLVRRAGEHCSVLRIDHVMGVHRLWWIPEGAAATDGTYVRYPGEELLAVIAAEAAATATTIVGENLGTVPAEVCAALARWDALGLHEEQFHLHQARLEPIPARSVAGVRTHDMAPFAAVAAIDDLTPYRRLLAAERGRPVPDGTPALLDAILERLAASDAYLVLADLEDLRGGRDPHNEPGRVLPTTWRRRLPAPISDMLCADVRRRARLLGRRS
ncbi:MAG: 4-alpha-glucanotransferase [Ilumatobacteraceae bacterium]